MLPFVRHREKLWCGLKLRRCIWRRQFNLCSLILTHTCTISCFVEKFYPSASSCAFHFLPLFDFLPFFRYFVLCYTPVWSPRVLPLSLFPPVSPRVSPMACFRFLFLASYFSLALTFNVLNFAIDLYFPFGCYIVLASFVFLFGGFLCCLGGFLNCGFPLNKAHSKCLIQPTFFMSRCPLFGPTYQPPSYL